MYYLQNRLNFFLENNGFYDGRLTLTEFHARMLTAFAGLLLGGGILGVGSLFGISHVCSALYINRRAYRGRGPA